MRVLLSGYYGFGNLGDEALLEVIVTRLRARFPDIAIDVLSNDPASTARLGVEATPRWEWRAIREAVAKSDAVLSGGGGLLQNATSLRSLVYYTAILREAVRARKKSMIFAQSIGPLDLFGRFTVRRFCKGLDYATVRDERSRALLSELIPGTPVEHTADPVFLYDAAGEEADLSAEGLGESQTPYAVVSVRKITNLREGVGTIARAIDRLSSRHGVRAAFLPLGGVTDAEVSTEIIRACASAPVLLPECPLAKAAAIIRGARFVVGMRLHALILAARYAVPFLAIAYDPKVSSLCEDLQYPLPPLWVPGRARLAESEADALVDRLVADRDALSAHLSARMDAVRAAAERNFDALDNLLGT